MHMKIINTTLMLVSCLLFSITLNAIEVFEFQNEAQQEQFQSLAEELRCPVCQNQSLADSGAGLADDLRQEIFDQIQEGKSNDAIIAFMVERYGDFIIYRPRFNVINLLLWTGPILLLILGFWFLLSQIKNNQGDTQDNEDLDQTDEQRLKELLNR